jgi:Flp pilus assembly protein TadD
VVTPRLVTALPPVPELLRPLLGPGPRAAQLFYGGVAVLALLLLLALWLMFGRGPRRRRKFHRAQLLLQQGAWKEALALARELQERRRQSAAWQSRLRNLEGECHRAASQAALAAKDYETALAHGLRAAPLLNRAETEARAAVIETMLAEVRGLFATTSGSNTDTVHQLIGRVLLIQADCPEASFWQGLCHVREDKTELALASLQTARGDKTEAAGAAFLDPLLYLGALLLREGQPREALRYLTEANRLDRNCPLVTWQLSTAMLTAGGDAQIAVRALQRALGPQGVLLWASNPQRLWVEAFPEARSFVRRLAAAHPYTCPLWGSDLQLILRQGKTALAQGLYRLGKFQEAADLFDQLVKESAPSRLVLRGLGLALARLEHYDEAFTHLRTAHDLEEPKDRVTAGYLALCGARARPLRPEDKGKNVAWALRLVTRFTAPGDAEWAGLVSTLFAEARALGQPLALEDQLYLCEHLLSVNASDAEAAAGYHELAATFPDSLRPEYAWLYCRAAQQHGVTGPHALELFARTFRDATDARAFFERQHWDFDEMEFAYLERAAVQQPGEFPPALGPDYPAHGQQMLHERSVRLEQSNQPEAALAAAEVWLKLAPQSAAAHDRLAYLNYQRGERNRAIDLLSGWQALEPTNPWPLLRQAVIHQQRGDAPACGAAIHRALDLAQDSKLRAGIAFLGARLALKNGTGHPAEARDAAQELLAECLNADPNHVEALWCLAAVRTLAGDQEGLAEQAATMHHPEVAAGRFHLLAAVCHLAAGDYGAVMDACQRAAAEPALAIESAYLMGWAYLYREDAGSAALALRRVAETANSPSAAHAQALLGGLRFHQGAYDEAVQWWKALDPQKRAAWKFAEPLHKTVFLSALEAFQAGQYEQAADKLREAGKLGLRDRRLGPLLTLTLVKAGQRLLYQEA